MKRNLGFPSNDFFRKLLVLKVDSVLILTKNIWITL